MRKPYTLFLSTTFIFAGILATGCKSSGNEKNIPGMVDLKLTNYGLPISVQVPDTTKTPVEVTTMTTGTVEIKSGKSFQIDITAGDADIQAKKTDLSQDDIKKVKRFITDEPTALVWEAQISDLKPEFHFYLTSKIGKDSYTIEDAKNNEVFGESAIKQMVEVAKNIKGIK